MRSYPREQKGDLNRITLPPPQITAACVNPAQSYPTPPGRPSQRRVLLPFLHLDELVASDTGLPSVAAFQSTLLDTELNRMIASPEVLRFERVRNRCAKYLTSAMYKIAPDFERGECACIRGAHGVIDEPTWGATTMPGVVNLAETGDKGGRVPIPAPPPTADLSVDYEKIFERGWLDSAAKGGGEGDDEQMFDQKGSACSPCAMGFVQLDNRNAKTGNIDRTVKVPYVKSSSDDYYSDRLVNLPLPCIAANSIVDNSTFGGSYTNVRLCPSGTSRCVNMLVDVSLGPSFNARRLLNSNLS
ncbi:hypothetical protein M8J77_012166 [Diaphorina citri]|nr:hypothetical protein M8J77_001181 [Diaphorina citri]KAI5707899.1 hypothetical protein M8J77_012166 [Diaphorina citri]